MNRRYFVLCGLIFASALAAEAQSFKLDVAVNYTGSGTVDESHKIYVAVWDSPDFMKGDSGGPPIVMKPVTSKSEVAHFDDLSKSPVYVSMLYDPSGKWDAASMPPSGSSVGLYSTEPGTPAPIRLEPGKTTKISAALDDSQKLP
jgi:hypothetical protein